MTSTEAQSHIQSIGDIIQANRELVPKEILQLSKLATQLESELNTTNQRLDVLKRIQKAVSPETIL